MSVDLKEKRNFLNFLFQPFVLLLKVCQVSEQLGVCDVLVSNQRSRHLDRSFFEQTSQTGKADGGAWRWFREYFQLYHFLAF